MCFGSRGFTSDFKRYQLDPHDAHDITRNNERMFVGHFFGWESYQATFPGPQCTKRWRQLYTGSRLLEAEI